MNLIGACSILSQKAGYDDLAKCIWSGQAGPGASGLGQSGPCWFSPRDKFDNLTSTEPQNCVSEGQANNLSTLSSSPVNTPYHTSVIFEPS